MLTLKTGKGPAYRRNLRTRNYHTAFSMDWLQEYDRREKEERGAQKTEEQEGAFYLDLPSSNTNNSIDNVCDCTLLNNFCDDSELAETRVGIG